MATFRIAPGFKVELVASEPLIQDPVVISFDADGRMWAAEMTSYMPDAYGNGEKTPDCRIVILEDTDGDGKYDKRSVWLDGLVLPRAILPLRDGALVATPPNLKFYRDTDGDGRADKEQLVASDYGNPKMNPEHQANGLLVGMDNWVYSVNHDARFRWIPDEDVKGDKLAVKWVSSRIPSRGQWGHSMDDFGRFYHNSNSDYLRADLVPPHYFPNRNPHYTGTSGVNVQLDRDQNVWPLRPTPAVNRGYRQGFLRPDGTLKEFTAACGPCVYRGGIFPDDCDGDVFVCEPSAHVVRRDHVTEDGLTLKAKNVYDKAEFLAATDERFRPVNIHVGPDGALYVVDLYRGILQHVYYLTPYLRELHLRRNMEQPVHMGRIYRVVHETSTPRKVEKLSSMTGAQLVEKLRDPNGWVRDTAQRLIVERRDRTVLAQLRAMAADSSGGDPRPALHALWTLEGINGIDNKTLDAALRGPPPAAAAAVRLSERFLVNPGVLARVVGVAHAAQDPRVRVQCAFTLSACFDPDATAAVARLLAQTPDDKVLRDAAMSGMAGRELETLELLLKDDAVAAKPAGADATLAALAGAVLREADAKRVERLFSLAADLNDQRSWQQTALLNGMADVARKAKDAARPPAGVKFAAAPRPFVALSESTDAKVADLAEAIAPLLHWPGKVDEKQDVAPPLSAAQQKLFDDGKIIFGATCAACHQATGEGLEGKAPPLRGSPWVAGHEGRLVRIVLNGVRGPIHLRDEVINMEMPNLAVLDDKQVASVLTYARREWGHAADPVDPETVAKVRAEVKGKPDAWTEEELLKVK
jgi:putative membrane-bound dehydrogenase-like protein